MPKRKNTNIMDENESELTYEEQRMENIRKNQAFLANLGLDDIKENLDKSKPTKPVSKRGVGARSGALKRPVEITRRSSRVTVERLRIEMEEAKKGGDLKVIAEKEALYTAKMEEKKANEFAPAEDNSIFEQVEKMRIEEEIAIGAPYNISDEVEVGDDREETSDSMKARKELTRQKRECINVLKAANKSVASVKQSGWATASSSGWRKEYASHMNNLSTGEDLVAKVTEQRIVSTFVHPSTSKLLVAAGDKTGNFGIWDVDNKTNGGVDGVYRYQPFVANLEAIGCRPHDQHAVFLGSRDGTVRTLDLDKDTFQLCFTAPESLYDVAFHSFDFNTHGVLRDGFLIGRGDGDAAFVDARTNAKTKQRLVSDYRARWELHDAKLNSIQQHPTQEHVVVSVGAGKNGSVLYWDARRGTSIAAAKNKKDLVLNEFFVGGDVPNRKLHEKSINAGYVSPDGTNLVTVSQDNTVKVWKHGDASTGLLVPVNCKPSVKPDCNTLRHDNHTGRWLSTFHPAFDPKAPNAFLLGSMERPRRLEVFTPTGLGAGVTRAHVFKDDYLGAVVSRGAFHPSLHVVVGGNSSGRCYVFR